MKKTLMLGAAALIMSATPVLAEEGTPPPGGPGPGHHKGDIMKELDADADGAISKAEFLAFHEKRFAEMDTNSDGSVSKEEGEAQKAKWKEKRAEWKAKHKDGDKPADAPADAPAEKPAE